MYQEIGIFLLIIDFYVQNKIQDCLKGLSKECQRARNSALSLHDELLDRPGSVGPIQVKDIHTRSKRFKE